MVKKQPQIIEQKVAYQGKLLSFLELKVLESNNEEKIYEGVSHQGAAVILPLTIAKEVLLVEQYRPVIAEKIWELPAGLIDQGESPLTAAKRELLEETGFIGASWQKLNSFYTTPGYSQEVLHLYLAKDIMKQRVEFEEVIRFKLFSQAEILNWLQQGLIKDSKTISGLLYYFCHDIIL